ncbi:8084_t:CDS:2, partial [Gigaspora rosea]
TLFTTPFKARGRKSSQKLIETIDYMCGTTFYGISDLTKNKDTDSMGDNVDESPVEQDTDSIGDNVNKSPVEQDKLSLETYLSTSL